MFLLSPLLYAGIFASYALRTRAELILQAKVKDMCLNKGPMIGPRACNLSCVLCAKF